MLNSLDRLRHHPVIGSDDENDDIRCLGTTSTHRRKGRMAWRVEERDLPLVGRDRIRANVLRNATGLARCDLRMANVVE